MRRHDGTATAQDRYCRPESGYLHKKGTHDRVPLGAQDLPGRHDRRRVVRPRDPLADHDGVRRFERMRQDHPAADDQPDDRPHRRVRPDRRRGHRRRRPRAAPSPDRLRHAERRVAAAPQGRRQHRDRAAADRGVQGRGAEACARPDGHRRTRPVPRRPLPVAAVRWAAAACRCRARPRRRPERPAHGRALRRRRPAGPQRPAGRADPAAARARQDRRVRHARHRRGVQARRPGRHPQEGRRDRPARHARRDPLRTRRRLRRELHRRRRGRRALRVEQTPTGPIVVDGDGRAAGVLTGPVGVVDAAAAVRSEAGTPTGAPGAAAQGGSTR